MGQTSQITHGGAQVEYLLQAHVNSLSPSAGPSSGGIVVTLSGRDFVPGRTACRFGKRSVVEALVLSSTEARCVTPPMIGQVLVEVTSSYVHDSPSTPTYAGSTVYLAQNNKVTRNLSFMPMTGATKGGTTVVISMPLAREGKPLLCRFGTTDVVC